LDYSPSYVVFEMLSRVVSPYQFNPLNFNPVQDVLEAQIDFDRVRCCEKVKVFISATNVRTGKIKQFQCENLSAAAVMASACLPSLFQAVEIDGEAYWDGGYMGNPAIYPLIYDCQSRDVVIVQVNPLTRDTIPTTPRDILDRVNEVSFNSTLMREMRAIAFLTHLIDEGELDASRFKRVLIHRIEAESAMQPFGASSKLNAEWGFLTYLRDIGREAAAEWLERNFHRLGRESTVDIETDYL
jgi:NTE family protein